MATHDVNDAFDPSFFDQIIVIRRIATVDNYGRVTTKDVSLSALAVIEATSPDDLQRLPEYEMMNKTIAITTPFRLQGPAVDEAGNITHPDEVLWHGSVFIVRALDDYSGFGRGFVHAIAVSKQNVDYPPLDKTVGSA